MADRNATARKILRKYFYTQISGASVSRVTKRSTRLLLIRICAAGARQEEVAVAQGVRTRCRREKKLIQRPQFTRKIRIRARNTQPPGHAHTLNQRTLERDALTSNSRWRELKSRSAHVISGCGCRDGLKLRKCGQNGTKIKVAQAIPNQK